MQTLEQQNSTHTPGPWFVVPYGDGDSLVICSAESGDWRIAFMATPGDSVSGWRAIKANARLIAAAPELLEALQAILPLFDGAWNEWKGSAPHAQARAAIAKATTP